MYNREDSYSRHMSGVQWLYGIASNSESRGPGLNPNGLQCFVFELDRLLNSPSCWLIPKRQWFHPDMTEKLLTVKLNRIHHGWSVEIGKSQPEGPSVPVGNEARRVSHWNDGPEG